MRGYKALAYAILMQAIIDAKAKRMEAYYWLYSDEAKFYYSSIDITEDTWTKVQDKITQILDKKGK